MFAPSGPFRAFAAASACAACALACDSSTLPAPTIEALTPRETYSDQATPVVVRGQNFFPGLSIDVQTGRGALDSSRFAGRVGRPGSFVALSDILWVSDGQLQATVEPGLPPGSYDVQLTDPRGREATLTDGFTSLGADEEPPHLTFDEPLDYAGFLPAARVDVVVHAADPRPGRLDAVSLVLEAPGRDPQTLRVELPDHPSETTKTFAVTAPDAPEGTVVTLTAEAGDLAATHNVGRATLHLVIGATPEVTAVEPRMGPVTGGNDVLVHGLRFVRGTKVTIGGKLLLPDGGTVIDANTIAGRAPPHEPGLADVTIKGSTGEVTLNDRYEYRSTPRIETISPAFGPAVGGTSVLVVGERFGPSTRIFLGPTLAEARELVGARWLDTSHIEGITPAGQSVADVWAVDPDLGVARLAGAYEYLQDLCVTSIEPDEGPEGGGTKVTVRGCAFTDDTMLYAGASFTPLSSVVRIDDTTLVGIMPPGSGRVDVVAASPTRPSATLPSAFAYRPQPTVTAVTPPFDSTSGGAIVRVDGAGFVPAMRVWFGSAESPSVIFESAGALRVTVPPSAAGVVNVTAATAFASWVLPAAFTYRDATMGNLAVSPERFVRGDALTIELDGERDAVGNPTPGPANDTVKVEVATDDDTETVTLVETVVEGRFVGGVSTGAGMPSPGDGVLGLAANAVVSVTYVDALTPSGVPQALVASAAAGPGEDGTLLLTPSGGSLPQDGFLDVTVTDGDPRANRHAGAANDSVTVSFNTSAGDGEGFLVFETDVEGLFRRSVALRAAPVASGSAALEVKPGDTVEATYMDALTVEGVTTGVKITAGGTVGP